MKPKVKIAVPLDFNPQTGYFLKKTYQEALTRSGVEPVPLLYEPSAIQNMLSQVAGVMLPGGHGDLNPNLYQQEKKYESVKINQERCDFEWALLEATFLKNKPLLTICWGIQMLNVFCGGSLHQHLPTDFPSSLEHEHPTKGHEKFHWVFFEPQGEAQKIYKAEKFYANSTHHQGLDRLGENLIVEGKTEDGLIECVRLKNYPFCWGVQWHPERLDHDPIIPAFVNACNNRLPS